MVAKLRIEVKEAGHTQGILVVNEPEDRYLQDDYLSQNPTWDMEDSPWKASLVADMLVKHAISPRSICEVGCGAGFVLAELRRRYADAELFGFDIAPAASRFWAQHDSARIRFAVGDFCTLNKRTYDAVLILDVVEHARDPFALLSSVRDSGRHFLMHIPLDLSALSVIRERPILNVRQRVGHIHYFTKSLALSLLNESGYRVVDWRYTGAGFSGPRSRLKTRFAMAPRWLAQRLNKDLAVRALGGETLLVLAEPNDSSG